jgi:hypothetical protein
MEIAMFLPIASGKCSHRLLDSCWAMLKGMGKLLGNTIDYKIAFGQFFQAIRRSPEINALLKLRPSGQMFLLAGCDGSKSGK